MKLSHPLAAPSPLRVELIYFNAGGGHRTAADALASVLQRKHPSLHVRKTNVMEVLDPAGYFKRLTGMAPEDYYNKRLASGFTAGLAQELKIFQGSIRLAHGALVRPLQQHWLRQEPDIVVSLIPNLNRPLCASLQSALPGVPYLTVMTDLADYPPDFWIVPDVLQHVACGSARALEQAREAGLPPERVHGVSGMILRPDFHAPPRTDRDESLRELGLDPARPTGIVLFGGHGSSAMLAVAKGLAHVQLLFLCGRNEALAVQLRGLPAVVPRAVLGYTDDVQRYMRLADFFIGKPGPGSISEAVHCGLPVVTVRNAWTMPQERYNTEWVTQHGLGLAGSSFARLQEPVDRLLARLPDFQARVRGRRPNRAVFEVADLTVRLARQSRGDGAQAPQTSPGTPSWAASSVK